jgi:hypothetical protein
MTCSKLKVLLDALLGRPRRSSLPSRGTRASVSLPASAYGAADKAAGDTCEAFVMVERRCSRSRKTVRAVNGLNRAAICSMRAVVGPLPSQCWMSPVPVC